LGELFKTLRSNAGEKSERRCLRKMHSALQSRETQPAMEAAIRMEYLTVLQILDKFPSVHISFERLCEVLNRQRVRLYSISSSPSAHRYALFLSIPSFLSFYMLIILCRHTGAD
jgi:sulfite reductase alpha subunit-like flavoprotein